MRISCRQLESSIEGQEFEARSQVRSQDSDGVHRTPEIGEPEAGRREARIRTVNSE
jgi:hypothetical protein